MESNKLPISSPDLPIEGKVVGVMDTEWTDKKHNLFLRSMEASFVNQLHRSDYDLKDLVSWLSRTQTYSNRSGLDPDTRTFGQFKVRNREKAKFKSTNNKDDIDNESPPLSENLWIQHFRPCLISKEPQLPSANDIVNGEFARQSIQLRSQRNEREATTSKQTLHYTSHKHHHEPVVSMTEVSDQNFVDTEIEGGEKLKRRCTKKRARPVISRTKDQVVPFVGQTSDEETKERNEEGSSKNLRITEAALQMGPEPSSFKGEETIVDSGVNWTR
ncbi:uncharacterized protein M6B38_179910 [Iris pallida]|uniref:Uncharacterized protein n=1 Tax=Iris pallida TaxID=29817 RepID=A0AAX6EN47_IRIPA|nr:uncharacterized protein M6B38_179910 [Iris pallida]